MEYAGLANKTPQKYMQTIINRSRTPEQQQSSSNPSTVNDQRAQLTADAAASPEARTYAEDDKCDGRTMHTVTLPDGTESAPFVCAHITRKGNGDTAGQLPTTREILYYAATTIHADGAGLHKRPEGVSYTNKYIPTLVAATHPRRPTMSRCWATTSPSPSQPRPTRGVGVMEPGLTTTSPACPGTNAMDQHDPP